MTRALFLTVATLLAAPALADAPAKDDGAPAARSPGGEAAAAPKQQKQKQPAKPDSRGAADLRAHPRTDAPPAHPDTRASDAPAKPAPCVEVKPCSID